MPTTSRSARIAGHWLLALVALLIPALAQAELPGKARPDQPSGNVSGPPSGFTFPGVPTVTWYQIWLEYDGSPYFAKWFSAAEADCPNSAGTCEIKPGVELPPGRYRWWIQTWNDYGAGPWSEAGHFDCDDGPAVSLPPIRELSWTNALGFVPNDRSVDTAFGPVGSNGVSALVITSTSPGSEGDTAPRKAVVKDLEVPPGYLLRGVRVCFEVFGPSAAVDGLRITQIRDRSPIESRVVLADPRRFGTNGVATCVDSVPIAGAFDPSKGTMRLEIGLDFGGSKDVAKISLIAVGLRLEGDPNSPLLKAIAGHTHRYLTGKGAGHNNTSATTSGAAFGKADDGSNDDGHDVSSDDGHDVSSDAGNDDGNGNDAGNGHGKGNGKGKDKGKGKNNDD